MRCPGCWEEREADLDWLAYVDTRRQGSPIRARNDGALYVSNRSTSIGTGEVLCIEP
jgi:hypothetical protein